MSSPLACHLQCNPLVEEFRGRALLAAVSGGGDSVALLRLCCELASQLEWTLHAAHFDHRTRPASADDAEWVRQLCAQLGVPFHLGTAEMVPTRSGAAPTPEEQSRDRRYEFLTATAEELGGSAILTAHTADDQAETMLHHLFRGTGLAGLAGIPAVRRLSSGLCIARPLLHVRRETLRSYLTEIGQDYREDPTNAGADFTRNRIRNELLPLLKEIGYAQVEDALLRLSAQAADAQSAVVWMAEQILAAHGRAGEGETYRLPQAALEGVPRHIVREVFVQIWRQMDWSRKKMGFGDWDRLADFASSGQSLHLSGGVEATSRGGVLRLRKMERG